MFKLSDRVKETTQSIGDGTITLLGAISGHFTFADANAIGNGNATAVLVDDNNGNWEAFFTTVTAGTPDTLSRGTLIKSSTGSRITFVAGTKTVACVPLVELMMLVSGSGAMVETDIASATTVDLGTVFTFRARITGTTTITGFGTQPNAMRWVRFAGALTLTHNAASLILLGGANHTTAAGDVGVYASDASGNWREIAYFAAAFNPTRHTGSGRYVHESSPTFADDVIITNGLSLGGRVRSGEVLGIIGNFFGDGQLLLTNNNGLTWGATTYLRGAAGTSINATIDGSNGVQLLTGATAWTPTSDEDAKGGLEPIDPDQALADVLTWRTMTGFLKADPDKRQRQFLIAQDIQQNTPEAVFADGDGVLHLDYNGVIPKIVAAIKALHAAQSGG